MAQLLIKRGLESNRTKITPQAGELIVTTDTKELYFGDGTTPGGNLIGGLVVKEWNLSTVSNQKVYSPGSENPLKNPVNGLYLIFISGVRIVPSDYVINHINNTITFTTAPKEDNESLSIIYIGK